MPTKLTVTQPDFETAFQAVLSAKREVSVDVNAAVSNILKDVQARGDAAVLELTQKFDRWDVTPETVKLTAEDIAVAADQVPEDQRAAIDLAASRIEAFHQRGLPTDDTFTDNEGVTLGARWTPVDAVGLYVPGGLAAYPSSVLMNALPARVAGVERLTMVVPTPDDQINPLILAAAARAGVTEVYRIGGAQAVAALAYGTETIAAVDTIVGPGNAYVAAAKRQVYGTVGIDMIAGPSEILVVADNQNDPSWIAADLLSQAEHDEVAQSILITDDAAFATAVEQAVEAHLATLERKDIAGASWRDYGVVIVVDDMSQAAPLVNRLAPEHLELAVEYPDTMALDIKHAGAIFLGRYTPEAIGDYVAGPNHVLPTARSARFSSGLNVLDFMKRTTLVKCTPESLRAIGPSAVTLANAEGLGAHALSVSIRLN